MSQFGEPVKVGPNPTARASGLTLCPTPNPGPAPNAKGDPNPEPLAPEPTLTRLLPNRRSSTRPQSRGLASGLGHPSTSAASS